MVLDTDEPDDAMFLPIASVNTLIRMSLESGVMPSLSAFFNLQHLQAKTFSSVHDMLWDHPGKLLSLCTSIHIIWYPFHEPEVMEKFGQRLGSRLENVDLPVFGPIEEARASSQNGSRF
jgi:hypothetical protein